MRFLHTADWQIAKPFQSLDDHAKRERLRQQRIDTVRGFRALIKEHDLAFVVVCGDLFDSATPDKAAVSTLCSAVGLLEVPVFAIPGNHDHGGPGCIWEQEFFQRERQQLAPNLRILLQPEPVVLDEAVLLPCPLGRRHSHTDPTAWLRSLPDGLPSDRPCIVLAHGSTQGFSSSGEDDAVGAINQIDLSRLPEDAFDYIALGDWHGMKPISPKVWFSGTPEQDRFARGESNQPGHILIVELSGRGAGPVVTPVRCGHIGWHELPAFDLTGDEDIATLEAAVYQLLENRAGDDLLKLSVRGVLSLEGGARFEVFVESLQARLIRLQLESDLLIEPSATEIEALCSRQDPLIAQVAGGLRQAGDTPLVRDALRELHLLVRSVS